ncbi:MAG: HEAT repeat domain-containing protein [Phycisphaeraceae bacterium]|nr:HEAT repeat domain-containing protein [Phycisphaeraceae bacterium]
MRRLFCIFLLGMLGPLAGACSPTPPRGALGFRSIDPADRLYAIRQAGDTKDLRAIPDLIPLLSSSDPGERMLAIAALERITGERLGYNPYASPAERDKALAAWEQAYRQGRFATR